MSAERSYLEHNGMPLQNSPNAGRVRHGHADAPWLRTFGAHSPQATEQKSLRMPGSAMPEPELLEDGALAEGTGTPRVGAGMGVVAAEPAAAPNLLQRATTAGGVSTAAAGAVSAPTVASAAQTSAQPVATHAAVGAPMGIVPTTAPESASMPGRVSTPMATGGVEMKPGAGRDDVTSTPVSTGAPGAEMVPAAPRVVVQKHITIQTEISAMAGGEEAMPVAGVPASAAVSPMATAMTMEGPAMMESGGVALPVESFAALDFPMPAATRFETVRVEMGAGNVAAGKAAPPAAAAGQAQGERSQQELLQRLSQTHKPAQPQESSGRRVHIGNLQITVQRPAMPAAQTPASAPSAQPQSAAAASPTYFNPWERLHTAFD